jgi:putative DNA primase/helicase
MRHSATLEEIARALGGDISNGQVLAPGPGHSPKDRSVYVRISADTPDGLFVGSFAGDD